MILYYLEVIFLAFVQGVSEFIPVSSSAHLFLVSKISSFNISSLELDISMHFGSLLSILIYFRKDLKQIYKNKKLLNLIFIGSIPLITFGFIFYYLEIIYILREIKIVAWSTLLFAILLYFADQKQEQKNINNDLNLKNIIKIGFFQTLALMPGVSRSGIVITACRISNFNRIDAAKISFFLSIPALAGASIIGLLDLTEKSFELNLVVLFSIFFSFLFSYLTIKFLLFYLKKFSLKIFVYYRIFLSFILFIIAYA